MPTDDSPSIPRRSTLTYPSGSVFDPDHVRLGPGLDDDSLDKLVGNTDGKRVLELGCGDGSNAIAMARAGARVIVVDSSAARLAVARRAAEQHDVRVEFHHADLADLAFVRGDQIDLCVAVYSLAEVSDLSRVFRQVHRVLRTEGPFLISLPHPLEIAAETDAETGRVTLTRTVFDDSPIDIDADGSAVRIQPHRITDVFTSLSRSNFRVDTFLEPQLRPTAESAFAADVHKWIPATAILRGRKQGI